MENTVWNLTYLYLHVMNTVSTNFELTYFFVLHRIPLQIQDYIPRSLEVRTHTVVNTVWHTHVYINLFALSSKKRANNAQ